MKGGGVILVTSKNKEKLHNRVGWNVMNKHPTVVDLEELRDRVHVFRDRAHAGKVLAGMLDSYGHSNTIVLGIPAGGLPVAAVIAEHLHLLFDILVVSKITLPWNSEAGYGAVAFDGTVRLNEQLLPRLGLNKEEIRKEIKKTFGKVTHRVRSLRGERAFPALSKQSVILVDDGLASGFTLIVGVEALRKAGARQIIVAVPTGHWDSVQLMAQRVEAIYCANIRQGWSFAVADAYERWSDVSDEEMVEMIKRVKQD
jgi:putative phosphoribosyl transferase